MAFDQPTRNRLASFVGKARALLTEEFTRQLQYEYGLDPAGGDVAELAKLTGLDDARRETARVLRDTLAHYLGCPADRVREAKKKERQETLDRIVREQAFTVLNRLCALRMAEARELLLESIARGQQSRGFQLYVRLAGTALGETGDAYRTYLFSLCDEFAVDLPVLFDRFSPQGRLFPREAALLALLKLINDPELAGLWAEDETIGWIYQYFNSKEERQAMRAESQAPRNSRELAVRNQFFTPRYVVEFLTDNTLGRIWYEMTQGQTALKESCSYLVRRPNEIFLVVGEEAPELDQLAEDLSQEELLRQPVYIPHRPLKDPRDILMLDPACGSLHFGLYAFDLYERIYDEAWELEERLGPDAFVRSEGLLPLHETYPDKAAFLRDVPRLIIERNIHGIDIDPRAVQIAGLSLWLRAQRSWQAQGVKPQDRPQIRRSNIVCAEPMPGNAALLEEFLKSLRADRLESLIRRVLDVPANQRVRATPTMADALCDLVRTVWKEMTLAGEAGSLLKIEEALTDAIARSKAEWEERTLPLFRVQEFGLTEEQSKVSYLKTLPGGEEDFWDRAEALVLAALQDYAEQAQNGTGYQRRLFASDAARGFAFVDLCRKRYDIALMNPPFGRIIDSNRDYLRRSYPDVWTDYYNIFLTRGFEFVFSASRVGAVLPNRLLETKKSAWLRRQLIDDHPLQVLVNIGHGVMDDAAVNALVLVASNHRLYAHDLVPTLDLSDRLIEQRPHALLAWSQQPDSGLLPSTIRLIPGHSINLNLSKGVSTVWERTQQLDPDYASVVKGGTTFDDFRFLRCWWETPPTELGTRWLSVDTGGDYQLFMAPSPFVENWALDGSEVRTNAILRYGTDAQVKQSSKYWFRPGISYPYTSSIGFGPRVFPANTILSSDVVGVFPYNESMSDILLGVLVSSWTSEVLGTFGNSRKTENSSVKNLPIDLQDDRLLELPPLVHNAQVLISQFEAGREISRFFLAPIEATQLRSVQVDLERIIVEIDAIAGSAYGFSQEMQRVFDVSANVSKFLDTATPDSAIQDVLSLAIGAVFGRWNILCASDYQLSADTPDPYSALPPSPPGMLQNAQSLPATPEDVPANYPLRISWSGILVDDEGHAEDIERRIREALRVIWGERADAVEAEACEILGVRALSDYLGKPTAFFADHLKRYSKSRRQAPIYWPLATPSGSYTLWLYYHRLTDQTLYACVNDFVEPKLRQVTDEANRLRQQGGRSSVQERELERLNDLQQELAGFRDELLRIAKFWQPNLNDGVQITAAPLWRLFQHRPWQKTLKETWEKLEAGDYDWAHLALSIWPERVIPKCVTDRSLAMAHDLEDLFWVEDGGRWRNFGTPEEEIAEQKRRQRLPPRERLRVLLAELTQGRARGLRGDLVHQHLREEDWDDLELTLLLWPERMAAKCWDDPLLAQTLGVKLPAKRTKAAFVRFQAERVAAGCPDLAEPLLAALQDRGERYATLWVELARGDRDDVALALALWPDRVVDKCAKDVEMAEGHGVRRFLWCSHPNDIWCRRKVPEKEVANEVGRRRSIGSGSGRGDSQS